MTVVKELECDAQILSGVVEKMVKGAKNVRDVGAELMFILLSESNQQFSQFFDTLEGKTCLLHCFWTPKIVPWCFCLQLARLA